MGWIWMDAILLIGRKRCGEIKMQVDSFCVEPKKEVKYLGIVMDCGLTGNANLDNVLGKVTKAGNVLVRSMLRTGGARRRLFAPVEEFIMLEDGAART